jgi:hypothetical protein
MASTLAMASQDPQQLLLAGSSSALADVTLQPVFIPRQHSSLSRNLPLQQAGSPPQGSNNPAGSSADWAYLLRNAAALRHGSMPGSDPMQLGGGSPTQDPTGRATSPHHMLTSPGSLQLLAHSQGMVAMQQQASNSASGLFGSSSMVNLDGLTQLSAEALAAATGDPSNSLVMLSNSTLAPTLSGMSGMYADGSVQTLYGSHDAAAAAAAAAAARATTTQSILQQQAAAAASNASLANSLGSGALAGLAAGNCLNINSLMKLEESLSGTLFGPGGTPAVLSPKPVSASLYIKVRARMCWWWLWHSSTLVVWCDGGACASQQRQQQCSALHVAFVACALPVHCC